MVAHLLIFALLLSPAAALGRDPRMGTEIEFRGKRQIPAVFCQASTAGVGAAFGGGVFATVMNWRHSKEDQTAKKVQPLILGGGAAIALEGLCLAVQVRDARTADSYLQRIHANLEPRQLKGELALRWDDESVHKRGLRVEFPNGRSIEFTKDANVVEVKTLATPASFARDVDFYQRELFETARRAGLRVPRLDGPWNGGHIHVDIGEAFDSDPRKFKNFLLDFIEHPELAEGVLVRDSFNAPAIPAVEKREAIEQAVQMLDRWAEEGNPIDEFTLTELRETGLFSKKSALNLNLRLGTLEIRSLRSQRSAAHLRDIARLLKARIQYTNDLPSKEFKAGAEKLGREAKARRFAAYVEEAGLPYEDFRYLAAPRYRLERTGCAARFAELAAP